MNKLRLLLSLLVFSLFVVSCGGDPASTDQPEPRQTAASLPDEEGSGAAEETAPAEPPLSSASSTPDTSSDAVAPEADGGSQIADEQRLATLTELTSFLNELPAEDEGLDNESMAAHLTGLPEFRAAGVSEDGTVWGEFTDGRLFMIFNNRPAEFDAAASGLPASPSGEELSLASQPRGEEAGKKGLARPGSSSRLALAPLAQGVSGGLPENDAVRLLWAMGTLYQEFDPREEFESWFRDSKYAPIRAEATVEGLKQVSGDGVFYFGSHGGTTQNIDGDEVAALWTLTPVDGFNETLLRNDISTGRVVYAAAPHDKNPAFRAGIDPPGKEKLYAVHYAITSEFIEEYMSFGPNSLVVMDSCSSDESTLRQAFVDKGASVYAGWTTTVGSGYAERATKFLFDRLLGTNMEGERLFPKQRPFDYRAVVENMGEEGILPACTSGGCPAGTTTLNFTSGKGDFELLMPSIAYMEVEEASNELFIYGMFGSEEGRVTIESNEVQVKNWTPETVSVELKDEGAGSAGTVVVEVREHKSNGVPLTEWRGEMSYSFQADALSPNLKVASTMQIHLRADVHAYRDRPGHDPIERTVTFTLAGDSEGRFTASGTADLEGTKMTLSGEGDLPVEENQPDHELAHFLINGKLLPQGILEGKPPQIVETDIHLHLASDNKLLTITLPGMGERESGFALNPTDVLFDQSFELDENFNIVAGNRVATGIGGAVGLGSGTLDWGELTAFHAPRLDVPPHASLPAADGEMVTLH
jgi:hypothetical protein